MPISGIIRKVDVLGRVVIPKEIRDFLEIKEQTPLEVFKAGENIILRKYNPECVFCNQIKENSLYYRNQKICPDCIKKLKKITSE